MARQRRVRRTRSLRVVSALAGLFAGLALVAGWGGSGVAVAAPAVAQTYYTPFEAQQYIDILRSIAANPGCCSSPVISTISITSGANGNTVVYDHFEDGYEADPLNPVQASTEVLTLDAGAVWTRTSNVPVDVSGVRGPGFFYDGRDRISATAPIAMTQTGYASGAGPLLAGGVQVLDFDKSGMRFDIPVGQDADYNQVFEYVGLVIVATADGTVVDLDLDADGGFESTVTLAEGEVHVVGGGVMLGAAIEANRRVSVYLATGDVAASYESRFFELYPTAVWSDEMISPVGAQSTGNGTRVFLFNPSPSGIDIDVTTGDGAATTIALAGRGQASFLMPVANGARFTSPGGAPFYGIQAITTEGSQTSAFDWGFTLIPGRAATPSVIVPYAPGSAGLTNNYSPVWISPGADTTIHVDRDGDPDTGPLVDAMGNRYDFSCAVTAFASITIYDDGTTTCYLPTENSASGGGRDMTGARIYTLDGTRLAAAWGQRPGYVLGNPALDMGTTILPFPEILVTKSSELIGDADGDGLADAGDEVRYRVTMVNLGIVEVTDVLLTDDTPEYTSYVPASVTFDGSPVGDDVGPWTASPLDAGSPEGGLAIGAIPAGGTRVVEFTVVVDTPIPFGVSEIANLATMTSQFGPATAIDRRPLDVPPLQIVKTLEAPSPVESGDAITYTVRVYNATDTTQSGITVTDALPPGTTYVSGSVTGDIDGTPVAVAGPPTPASELSLQPGATLTITFSVTVDAPIAAGVTHLTNTATAWSAEHPEPVSDDAVAEAAPRAALALSKVDDETAPLAPGDALRYTITVVNTGPDEADGVTIVDTLPVGVTFDPAAGDPSCQEGPVGIVTCTIGDLGIGSTSLDIGVVVDSGVNGIITNTATVTATTADGDPDDDTDTEDTEVDAPPSVAVTKSADPEQVPEPGGVVTFGVTVTNLSFETVTLVGLVDDVFGDLRDSSNPLVAANTCVTLATELAVDASIACSFQAFVAGDASGPEHLDTITVAVADDRGTAATAEASAYVSFRDVMPEVTVTKSASVAAVAEPGGPVTFIVTVANDGVEPVDVVGLVDSVFGDLLDPGNLEVTDNGCLMLPGSLAAGVAFGCQFTGFVGGNGSDPDHVNTVTVTARDDDGNEVSVAAEATVALLDVPPQATVSKQASVGAVTEPGGTVTFTVIITNGGPELLTLDELTDSIFGDLLDPANPSVAANDCVGIVTVPANDAVTCSFSVFLAGLSGDADHVNTVVATLSDDEGTTIAPYDDAVVGFAPAGSTIGGLVFEDTNRNGMRDTGEVGLVGVTVSVTGSGGGTTMVVTAGDGTWWAAVLPGMAQVMVDGTTAPSGHDLTTANEEQSVTAVAGEHVGADDVGYGPPPGGITGTMFLDLDGDPVRGPHEPPLAGVDLELLDGTGTVLTVATSGADGGYTFSGTVPGIYTVRVVAATVPPGLVASTDYDGGADGSAVVVVAAGVVTSDVDFGHRGTGTIGDTVWFDEDEDGVPDPAEPRMPGARVTLVWWGPDGVEGTADDHDFGLRTTDGDGHYAFTHLPPGSYTLTVLTSHLGLTMAPTTPTRLVVALSGGQSVLSADFGFAAGDDLPLTGIDAERLLVASVLFLAVGGALVGGGARRERRFRLRISRILR